MLPYCRVCQTRMVNYAFPYLQVHCRHFTDTPSEPTQGPLTEKQQENILLCLNTLTPGQLRRNKSITPSVTMEIWRHRKENGPFSTLEAVKNVKNIGSKSFAAICDGFKSGVHEVQSSSMSPNVKWFSPTLTPQFLKTISDVTSLELCSDCVHFSTMTRDCHLKHWDHIHLEGSNHLKQKPAEIMEQAFHVVGHLPKSSVYLMESRLPRKLTPSYMQLLLSANRLQAAIQVLVNKEFPVTGQHRLFHVKDSFTIDAFGLRVGGERVSSQHVVKQMQEGHSLENVIVSPDLWRHYHRQNQGVFKERYSNCLLLSAAFCQHINS